ncbi:ArnT family glycosyltransferase [Leeuwenhoekiella sp. NPDC079379]|uniref:ArnT family glycosyltransferase n=1 Tax=Leeuwenhoekiella sp. NPDC079379 TaxID=3364122 RepID=UPI0037C95168
MKIHQRYYPFILIAVCLFLFFPHLDVLYANIMEARNFNTAREMLHYDNWVFTTMNGEARYEKPPLPTWLSAFSAAIFGITKLWALRLPSAIITTLMVLFSYVFSNKCLKLIPKQAFYASLILATSFYVLFAGRNGTWDIFAHSFMLAGIYFLFQFFAEIRGVYRNAILAGLFIGMSFMSKGPVSHFALLLPFLIAYTWVYKIRSYKNRILPLSLLLLIALALSSWWALTIYFGDVDTASSIADKEAAAWANHNTRSFFYYWSFFTQSGIWTIPAFISLLYPYLKTRVSDLKTYRFTLIWTLAAVILLSVIPEKKSRYLLPVLIPLALNTSYYIEYLVRKFSELRDKRETYPVYFNFGVVAFVAILAGPIVLYFFADTFTGSMWVWFTFLKISVVFIAVLIFRSLKSKNIENAFYAVIIFSCALITFGFPLVKATYTNEDYAMLAPKIESLKADGKPVFLFENGSPELIWDLGQRLPVIKTSGSLVLPEVSTFYLIIEKGQEQLVKGELKAFNLTLDQCFDGNITSKKDRNYKTRRIGCIYSVTVK